MRDVKGGGINTPNQKIVIEGGAPARLKPYAGAPPIKSALFLPPVPGVPGFLPKGDNPQHFTCHSLSSDAEANAWTA